MVFHGKTKSRHAARGMIEQVELVDAEIIRECAEIVRDLIDRVARIFAEERGRAAVSAEVQIDHSKTSLRERFTDSRARPVGAALGESMCGDEGGRALARDVKEKVGTGALQVGHEDSGMGILLGQGALRSAFN